MLDLNRKIVIKPKPVLLILAFLVVMGAIYYFTVAVPARNEKAKQAEEARLKIEAEEAARKRIDAEFEERRKINEAGLKAKIQQIEMERIIAEGKAIIESEERKRYRDCLEAAEKEYWDYVKLNGGEEVRNKPGVYTAPTWVWDGARKKRQDALDACDREHRLFKEIQ